MNRLFSFVLILLLLLNVMGYYGVLIGLEYKNDASMTRKLDATNYQDAQTVTIRIPLVVPYATDAQDFERVSGTFEHEGQFYQLIKQKLSRDTLTVVCIKDDGRQEIQQAMSSYVKSFTDKGSDVPAGVKVLPVFIKDYIQHQISVKSAASGWEDIRRAHMQDVNLIASYSASIVHPPERV